MSNKNLNNLYNSKYLKYKNKYIQLKKQLGSGAETWDTLENKSNEEVTNYKTSLNQGILNNTCPHSNYTFTGFSSDFYKNKCAIHKEICDKYLFTDVENNGLNCLKCLKSQKFLEDNQIVETGENVEIPNYSTRYNENFEINEVCNEISEIKAYFKTNNIFNYVINLESREDNYSSDDIILDNILLSTNRYVSKPFTIELQNDKDLICSEGNIKYIDSSCNVGSGVITSCLFVILELEDKKSIIFHLNGLLDNCFETSNYIDEVIKYKFTPSNCFTYIKENFQDIKNLTKIYLVGVTKNYTIDDATDGFIYVSEKQLSKNNLNSLNNEIIVDTIKTKLKIPSEKKISLVKHYCGKSGNYIYTNNSLFYLTTT